MYWSVFFSYFHLSSRCLPAWSVCWKAVIPSLLWSISTNNCLPKSMALTIFKSLQIHFIPINFLTLFKVLRYLGNSWWNISVSSETELNYEFVHELLRSMREFCQFMVEAHFISTINYIVGTSIIGMGSKINISVVVWGGKFFFLWPILKPSV